MDSYSSNCILLLLNINPCSVTDFNPDESIQRWWEDKDRRPNKQLRQPYKKRTRVQQESQESESGDEEETDILMECLIFVCSSTEEL